MKIKLNGKRLYPNDSVKYLGVKFDSKLNWKSHVSATATKLNRANAILYKVRDFVNANILKSIYYALFESHIKYACIIWGQNISTINRLNILQKKALRIINFKQRNAHSSLLFHYSKIIKIADKVKMENCLFIKNISIINYFKFLLIGLHFHQCLTIMKHRLPPKEIFKSLVSKQHHMEKMLLFIWL